MGTLRKFILPIAAALGLSATFFSFTAGASPSRQASPSQCFDHSGVQLGTHNAWECAFKDADEAGTLYWQRNNSDYAWDLHPDSGNLVVNAATTRISPENNYYGFTAIIASSEGGCMVVNAGYDQHPTECANPNKPPKLMSPRQQASYNDFAEVMREGAPDCAWMPNGTDPAKTC